MKQRLKLNKKQFIPVVNQVSKMIFTINKVLNKVDIVSDGPEVKIFEKIFQIYKT